jgi:hypothetical protein
MKALQMNGRLPSGVDEQPGNDLVFEHPPHFARHAPG